MKELTELKTKWEQELKMWKDVSDNKLFYTANQVTNALTYSACIASFLTDINEKIRLLETQK